MRSTVCALDGQAPSTAAALQEAETFAGRCGLSPRQALHLRLLSEELLGVLNGVVELREGSFWIEREGPLFRLCISAQAPVGEEARSRLLKVASTGEDEFHRGISGKLRQALEWLSGEAASNPVSPTEVQAGLLPSPQELEWSLEVYRRNVAREKKAKAWDELERSVLNKLADEVRVGVRARQVSITITKRFPDGGPGRTDGKG